ncbi:MAG: hypothetical protein MI867_03910, partial [Pseudomonadales bacterium]|nr:hypothetical protein [Pseudomonadales bacterium]
MSDTSPPVNTTTFQASAYYHQLDQCLAKDRFALKKLIKAIVNRSRQAQPFDQLLRKLESKLEASKDSRSRRSEAVPDIQFPDQLPVSQNADKIIAAIRENPVVIIAGETGSGKSTQLPKMCLKAGRGIDGKIA